MLTLADALYPLAAGEGEVAGGGSEQAAPVPSSPPSDSATLAASPPPDVLLGGEQPPAAEPFLAALPAEDDAEGWGALWRKLGRPDTAEGYALPVLEGDDGAFAKTSATWLHEAGLSQSQAQALATQWNAYQVQQAEQYQAQRAQQNAQNLATLRQAWSNQFDANAALVQQAEARFAPPEVRQLFRDAGLGNHPGLVRLFFNIGQALCEAPAVNGEPAESGPKSTADIFYGTP